MSTWVGCIPFVGTVVGIGRIAIALSKASELQETDRKISTLQL